jgi:hypothetical protein
LVYFSRFGIFYQEKSGNPGLGTPSTFCRKARKLAKSWKNFFFGQKLFIFLSLQKLHAA